MSIYRAFEQISDGRHKRGVRYSVALILTLIVLAKAAGMTTLQGIAEWVRLRWAIENRSHYRRDVSLREDHCQVRNGEAPRILAVLNSGLLALLDLLGVTNAPKQMRLFDAYPLQAIRLLLGSPLTFK